MIQVRLADGRAFLLDPEMKVVIHSASEVGEESVVQASFAVSDIVELRMALAEITGASGRNPHGDTVRVLMFVDPDGIRVSGPPMTPAMSEALVEHLSEKKIDIFTSLPPDITL